MVATTSAFCPANYSALMIASALIYRCLLRRLELDDQLVRYPATVLDCDALTLGPVPDLGGARPAGPRSPASPAATGTAALPCGLDERRDGLPELLGVLRVQVDLVLRAAEGELDGAVCLAAVYVICEYDLRALRHRGLLHSRREDWASA